MNNSVNTNQSTFTGKFLIAILMMGAFVFVQANAAETDLEFSDQVYVEEPAKIINQDEITSLAEFITTKFKLLSTLKKESQVYVSLHNELFGQEGLVEDYMVMTDYDFDKMNRLYTVAGGLKKFN